LLKREPKCVAELFLAHADEGSTHPHPAPHMLIDGVRGLFRDHVAPRNRWP
jgi:hypothetical protein